MLDGPTLGEGDATSLGTEDPSAMGKQTTVSQRPLLHSGITERTPSTSRSAAFKTVGYLACTRDAHVTGPFFCPSRILRGRVYPGDIPLTSTYGRREGEINRNEYRQHMRLALQQGRGAVTIGGKSQQPHRRVPYLAASSTALHERKGLLLGMASSSELKARNVPR
jgi:hypothetical protein